MEKNNNCAAHKRGPFVHGAEQMRGGGVCKYIGRKSESNWDVQYIYVDHAHIWVIRWTIELSSYSNKQPPLEMRTKNGRYKHPLPSAIPKIIHLDSKKKAYLQKKSIF